MSCDDRLQNASSLNTVKVHLTKLMAMNVAGLPQLPLAGIYDFLDKTYKPLEGQIFSATYKESRLMPQTNNLRDILVVEVQNPFAATLKDIRDKVLAMCGEKVWKGITCTVWGDVCLWVEPTFVGIINAGSTLWFKIEEATVFPCYPGTGFPHGGVSIKASLSPPTPQTPSTIPMIQMATGFPHGGGSINANPLTPQILSPFHQVTQMATGFPHGGGSIKANPLTPQILSPIHQVTQMVTGFPHGGGSIKASLLTPEIPSTIHQVTQMATGFPHGGGQYQGKPADARNSVYYPPSDPNGHRFPSWRR